MRPTKLRSSIWYDAWVRTSTCDGSTVMCGCEWYLPRGKEKPFTPRQQLSKSILASRPSSLAPRIPRKHQYPRPVQEIIQLCRDPGQFLQLDVQMHWRRRPNAA